MTSASANSPGKDPSCGQKCGSFWAASSKHIAVIVAIIVYSCLGGKIFQILEEGEEEKLCWNNTIKERGFRHQALKAIW